MPVLIEILFICSIFDPSSAFFFPTYLSSPVLNSSCPYCKFFISSNVSARQFFLVFLNFRREIGFSGRDEASLSAPLLSIARLSFLSIPLFVSFNIVLALFPRAPSTNVVVTRRTPEPMAFSFAVSSFRAFQLIKSAG